MRVFADTRSPKRTVVFFHMRADAVRPYQTKENPMRALASILFVFLPLAAGVGCTGCENPFDDTQVPNDTGDSEDPDGFNAVFNFDPVSGTPLVVTAQGEDEESCTAPCSIVVHKTGNWYISAQDEVFWFISWVRKLESKDDDATFTYQWDEDYSYGVKIEESVYISEVDGYEYTIQTMIIEPGGSMSDLGHDLVVIDGLPLGSMPLIGYTFDVDETPNEGYRWTGYVQEDLEIIHWEKWDVEGVLLYEEDMRREH